MPAQKATRDFEILQALCMLEMLPLYFHAIFHTNTNVQGKNLARFFACGGWHDSKCHLMKNI